MSKKHKAYMKTVLITIVGAMLILLTIFIVSGLKPTATYPRPGLPPIADPSRVRLGSAMVDAD